MKLFIFFLFGFIAGAVLIWFLHAPRVEVQACPNPKTTGEGAIVLPAQPPSCAECLPRCSSELDGYLDVYLKMRGIGATIALREGK